MDLVELQNVTIISERFLKDDIIDIIKKNSAKGYTLTDVSGEGSRGIRASEWEGKNVKIETVVSSSTSDRIIQAISDHYFENYAVIAYTQTVNVVRGEKYI
jgi:nitrogen regulatory protein PII